MKKILISLLTLLAITSCSCDSTQPAQPADDAAVVEQVIMSRRSIRKFTDATISRDTLDRMLLCGINAPNGQNRQAYEIRVVQNPALLDSITAAVIHDHEALTPQQGASNIFLGSQCVIFIANDRTYDVSQVDCGLLAQNIMLSAWSMGIGSCTMAYPTRLMNESPSCAPLISRLGFSEDYNLLFCLAMGYPDESPEARPRKTEKIQYVE